MTQVLHTDAHGGSCHKSEPCRCWVTLTSLKVTIPLIRCGIHPAIVRRILKWPIAGPFFFFQIVISSSGVALSCCNRITQNGKHIDLYQICRTPWNFRYPKYFSAIIIQWQLVIAWPNRKRFSYVMAPSHYLNLVIATNMEHSSVLTKDTTNLSGNHWGWVTHIFVSKPEAMLEYY